jgi:DNA-binding PadR family transcriptional regulator
MLDETIHQIVRLKIMAALTALPAGEMLEFIRLRAIVAASDGNLATHLNTLDAAGYIAVLKDYVGKKPRTRIAATAAGRTALERHVAYLRGIIDGTAGVQVDDAVTETVS